MRGIRKLILLGILLVLSGCAANKLPGYQNAYQGYNVPENLINKIRLELSQNGLKNAEVVRDNVGRVRLSGSYSNEDEVDAAYIVVQSNVGLKSTSPLYPEKIQTKRWEMAAKNEIERHFNSLKQGGRPTVKRALIIGINNFLDADRLKPIMGEDDAKLVKLTAEKAGYKTTALLGKNATKFNIELALDQLKRDLSPNDSLLIYISSHGNQPIPSHQGGDVRKMSIAAYDSGDPYFRDKYPNTAYKIKLHNTSVSDVKVQEVAKMPTKQTRIIIDTCYSGEILKGIPDESTRYILSRNGGIPEQAGISIAAWTGPAYSSKGIIFTDDGVLPSGNKKNNNEKELQQKIDTKDDLNRYTLITATSDGEQSWGPSQGGSFDSPVNKNKKLTGSFFTQSFFEFLEMHGGHFEPAFRDARNFTITKVAREVSRGEAKPVTQTPRLNPPMPIGDPSNIYN